MYGQIVIYTYMKYYFFTKIFASFKCIYVALQPQNHDALKQFNANIF